ncbi:helix-turn-helix transcriptional regulator [Nocardia sp. CA2R105]|uniref:helix-turn-helix transcriptional regulator n=1 Tax=Nocardia coffeae TaxID=2873381 RepID=UPI001CA60680|nr:helix-turn-helix transcriptional regulator [Nocardia coffeae]MBY8857543.1 helix-turn-helix transcriptional regulator [Nocardia coffeae]
MPANRLGEFLRARRAAVQPPADPQRRRRQTPGLRREEVAVRATISTDYYVRLEQGRERNPSPQVVDALATALELSTAETSYLHGLVSPPPAPRKPVGVREEVNEFLSLVMRSWEPGPAYIVNHRSDVLAANRSARELFERFEISDNILRMLFLDPAAPRIWADRDAFARFFVGGIRRMIGPAPQDDPVTTALLADVSARNPAFAELWNRHEIGVPERKQKWIHHEELGEIRLDFELLAALDTPHQYLVLHRIQRQ